MKHIEYRTWRARGRAALAAVAALGIALGVGACQGIPSSGDVHAGLSNLEQTEQQVLFSPAKPAPGATQEEIVRGFVFAASSATDDYAIAREFLTEDYSGQWDPSIGVLIDDDSRTYRTDQEGVSILQLSAVGEVSAEGILTPLPAGSPTEVRFELSQEEGEWRISSAPAGVILDRTTFTAVWSPHQLYFGSQDGVLIPDTRWYLSRATMSTHIVNGLLAGPAPSLQGAAVNGFPSGTVLAAESVPVVNGVAQVTLSTEFEEADETTIELVTEQLRASLNTVPSVTHFTLSVGPVELLSEAVAGPQGAGSPVDGETGFLPGVVQGGSFGRYGGNGFEIDAAFTRQLEGLGDSTERATGGVTAGAGGGVAAGTLLGGADAITMAPDQEALVARTDAGAFWITHEDTVEIDSRGDLLWPTVDRFGAVWTAESDSGELVSVTRPSRDTRQIEVPWLAGLNVVDLRVSPGGHRIAAMVADERGTRVMIAGIIRDESGMPTQVVPDAVDVFWATGDPIDLDWIDDQRVVTLSDATAGTKVTIGGPGTFAREAGSVLEAVAVRGGGAQAAIRLINADGDMFAPQGPGWQRQTTNVTLLTKRG